MIPENLIGKQTGLHVSVVKKPAFISTNATKAKCLYYYEVNPGPNTNICGACLNRYTKQDEFNGHEDIFICKDHLHCLVFFSKKAKINFKESEDNQEEFEELKKAQGYFEKKPPSFEEPDGEWVNEEDIFNKTVEEARFFSPEHINNNPELTEARDRYNNF